MKASSSVYDWLIALIRSPNLWHACSRPGKRGIVDAGALARVVIEEFGSQSDSGTS
jgi:hypothetical protein